MASDQQQYNRMQVRYEALHAEHAYSVAPDVGRLAIVTMYPDNVQIRRPEDSLSSIDFEARRLQAAQEALGKTTIYAARATVGDFWEILGDRNISDITLIGLGQLGKISLRTWERGSTDPQKPAVPQPTLNYFDAISHDGRQPSITHLKQGSFHQRTSGLMPATLNVPFAWGFMADRSKIWGSPQRAFYPHKHDINLSDGIVNIAQHFGLPEEALRSMEYSNAKVVFGKQEPLTRVAPRYPVPSLLLPIYDRIRDNKRALSLHEAVRRRLRAAGIVEY